MGRKPDFPILIAFLGILVALGYAFTTVPLPGIPADLGDNFMAIFPGLLITVFFLVITSRSINEPGGAACLACTGVAVSVLLGELEGIGMLSTASMDLATMQFLTVIIFFLIGVVTYLRNR